MKKLFIYFIVINIAILFSCSPIYVQETYYEKVSLKPYLDKWIGKTENVIIDKFGMPSNSYTTDSGNKILKYIGEKRYHSNSIVIGGMAFNNVITSQHYIEFYINKDGRVYSYRANLPRKYEPRTRTVRKDNSEDWFYGIMGLLLIASTIAVLIWM